VRVWKCAYQNEQSEIPEILHGLVRCSESCLLTRRDERDRREGETDQEVRKAMVDEASRTAVRSSEFIVHSKSKKI